MVMDPTLPRIKVRDLLMQAFLTGWERSDKSTSQDEYLQSSIQVIEMLQVEPENSTQRKVLACRTAKRWIIWMICCGQTASGCTTGWKQKTSS